MRAYRLASASLLALAGCAGTAPLSFVTGVPASRNDFHLYPVRVVSVDGKLSFDSPREPVSIAPGPRWLVLEAAPAQGARGTVQQSFLFKVKPCTRYTFAARRESAVAADWTLVVDREEPVSGCQAEEELRKAGVAAAPAASSAAPAPLSR